MIKIWLLDHYYHLAANCPFNHLNLVGSMESLSWKNKFQFRWNKYLKLSKKGTWFRMRVEFNNNVKLCYLIIWVSLINLTQIGINDGDNFPLITLFCLLSIVLILIFWLIESNSCPNTKLRWLGSPNQIFDDSKSDSNKFGWQNLSNLNPHFILLITNWIYFQSLFD